jgi:hypothetical protein
MADYITLLAYKERYGVTVTDKNVRLAEHITAASRKVDAITHRQFDVHTGAASVRYFRPTGCDLVFIDDAYEITAVAVDDSDAGTYSTVWATTDYETDPANGIGQDGQSGWPVTALRAIGTRGFPYLARRAVKVTAKWGWAAVPDAVQEATYLLASRLAYEVAVPGGITPANPEFGIPGTPLQRPFTAEGLLKPYMRTDRVIGVAG